VRSVELAIYADALAGEAASLAARAERARSRLNQAAIERRARAEVSEITIVRLEELGLLGTIDESVARSELRELEAALDALEELQAWVEAQLAELSAA
jgi:hypothetical protein